MNAIIAKITKSGKTAIAMVKESKFSIASVAVYIPNDNYTVKQEIAIPDNLKVVDWQEVTLENGKTVMLKQLGLK